MKKILSILLPSLLIFIFVLVDSMFPLSKYILLGIYLFFPLVFIIQGIICSNSMKTMIVGLLLSSAMVMFTISIWYNMSSMIIPVIIYLLLGAISFFLANRNKRTPISEK